MATSPASVSASHGHLARFRERFLRQQDLWSFPKNLSPARSPPYHRKVTRPAPTRQQEIFTDT